MEFELQCGVSQKYFLKVLNFFFLTHIGES